MKKQPTTRRVNPKSIEALRSVHASKRKHREVILSAALERMASGKPAVLKPGFKWNRANLAREADIHINTLLQRDEHTRAFLYEPILNKLDTYASRRKNEKVDLVKQRIESLRAQLDEAIQQRDKALKAIKVVEWDLIKEREFKLSAIRDKEALIEKLNKLSPQQ
jgi:hypothetical protein